MNFSYTKEMATKYNVITWGDSGGCGVGDSLGRDGVPCRLRADFWRENAEVTDGHLPSFHNASVHGTMASMLRRRMHHEMEARRRGLPILSIVGIGGNDAMLRAKNKHPVTWERRFAAHLGAIAKQALHHDGALLYIGMAAVDPDKVNPYRGSLLVDPARTKRFEAIACDVVTKVGGTALALFEASERVNFAEHMVSADGLHPNAAGYDWMYAQAAPVVHELWEA